MTASTTSRKPNPTKETTSMIAKTAAPASDPKPSIRKRTHKEAAAETVVPEKTPAQKAQLFKTAMGAVTRAIKAAEAVQITDDDRTLERANHLFQKVATAKQTANERAKEAGLEEPFPGDQAVFAPITRPEPEPNPDDDDEKLVLTADGIKSVPKSRKGTRKPAAEKPAAPATFEISLQNMSDGSVHGHAAGCADIGKRKPRAKVQPQDEAWTFTVQTKHEAWAEYNSDFLAEGEESGTYPINWLPCASAVPQGPDDTYEVWAAEEAGEQSEPEVKEPFKATAPKARKAATTAKAGKEAQKVSRTTTVKKEAAPKPKKEQPTPESRSRAKADALAEVATDLGWDVTQESEGQGIRVTIRRGADDAAEELGCVFIDGKLGLEPSERPYYKSAQRPRPVLLRNVSAMRQQMDADETKRPLARETTRVVRTERSDRPRKSFGWDDELSDEELLESFIIDWSGKRVEWRVTSVGDERFEVVVGKVAKVERVKSTGDRAVSFYTLEYSDKEKGMVKGALRTVALKSILRLI